MLLCFSIFSCFEFRLKESMLKHSIYYKNNEIYNIVMKFNLLFNMAKTKQLNSWEIIEFMTEKITMLFQERLIIS